MRVHLQRPYAVIALLLLSCNRNNPVDEQRSGDSGSASTIAEAGADKPIDTDEVLALAPVKGHSPTDRLLKKRQTAVRALPSKVENWALLGYAWVTKARVSADPGYYLNARASAKRGARVSPNNSMLDNLLGLTLLNEHKFKSASALAKRVLAREPRNSMALGVLSDSLLELGDVAGATKAVDAMMAAKPNLPSYSRMSYLAWLRGEVKTAVKLAGLAFDSGRSQTNREPAAWILVQAADIYWHRGDFDGADAGYALALEHLADYAPALVGQARVRLARKQPADAARLLQKAQAISPLVRTAWLLGDARLAANDKSGADKAYAEAERLGRQGDHRSLALFYATKKRKLERAFALAAAELEARKGIYTQDAYAWAAYRLGKLAEARKASDRSVALGTPDAQLLFHAGAIRLAQGERTAGRKLVRRALRLNPHFDLSAAAEARDLLGRR